MVKLKEDNI